MRVLRRASKAPGLESGTLMAALVKGGKLLLVFAGEVPRPALRDDRSGDILEPSPRIPKAHKANGKFSFTSRGREDGRPQPRRNTALRLAYS